MSNSSSSHQLVQALGGSFFHWISTEVLAYVLGSTLGLCVLIGVVLNIILLVVYVKRQLYNDPTSDFIPQMAIVDLIASFIVILPSVVASIMGRWPLPDAVCQIHGVLVTWVQLLSFALLYLIFIERVVKAWNPSLHGSTFSRHKFVVVISIITCAVDLLLSLLPVLGFGSIDYGDYQYQCSLVNKESVVQMHFIFALGVYGSPLICLFCFGLLLEKRRRNILNEQTQDKNKLIQLSQDTESGQGSTGDGSNSSKADVVKNGPSKAWSDKPTENGRTPLFKKNPDAKAAGPSKGKGAAAIAARKRSSAKEAWRRRLSRPPSTNLVHRIFRDSENERDHHQAMTVLITWSIIWICWVWYVIASLLDVYSAKSWGGWYTLGVLLADATYCIKPFIYLAHNRHYRKAGAETVPQAVKEKATKVRQSVSTAVESIDNVLFHSPGATKATKFQATISAQLAAIRWKRRAAVGILKFGKKKEKAGSVTESKDKPSAAGDSQKASAAGALSASKPTTTTALAAAAMQKLAETKLPESTAVNKSVPGTPGNGKPPLTPGSLPTSGDSTRLGTAERPATKTSVVLSVGHGDGGLTPKPPSTGLSRKTSVAESDLVQPASPFSPEESV